MRASALQKLGRRGMRSCAVMAEEEEEEEEKKSPARIGFQMACLHLR